MDTVDTIIKKIAQWHRDRNLIDGSDDKTQYLKLSSEMGELSDSIARGESVIDDIGDILVVLVNIAERNGLTLLQCMEHAYSEIKDRKGRMVDGTFVKEENVPTLAELSAAVAEIKPWECEICKMLCPPKDLYCWRCGYVPDDNRVDNPTQKPISKEVESMLGSWQCGCGNWNSNVFGNCRTCQTLRMPPVS
jgi:NTP pyrophosphatase (non-canonical NTP hydrolase)